MEIIARQMFLIYRVELYYLMFVLLLDINNPLHISIFWSSYSYDLQWHIDYFISWSVNNKTMYVSL